MRALGCADEGFKPGAILMVGGIGTMGIGRSANQLMSQLHLDIGKMATELAGMQMPLAGIAKSLQDAFAPISSSPATGALAAFSNGKLGPLFARLAYVAVLKNAMEKASADRTFNIETAINDLWVHLDGIRKIGAVQPAATDAASAQLLKLREMMDKQRQLFETLSDMIKNMGTAIRSPAVNLR